MAAWIAPLISAVGSLGNAAINWFTGKTNTEKTIEAQKEMADYQYKLNKDLALDAWKRETEYNSPASQMQRLRDAGLNENLIYGNLNNSPQSFNTTGYVAPKLQYNYSAPQFDVNSILSMFNSARITDAQTSLMREQASKEASMSALYNQELLNKQLDFDIGSYDFEEKKDLRSYRYLIANNKWKLSDMDVQLAMLEKNLKKAAIENMKKQNSYLGEQINYLGRRNDYQDRYHLTEDMNWYNASERFALSLMDLIPNPNNFIKAIMKNYRQPMPKVGFR